MKNRHALLIISAIVVFCMSFSIVAYAGETPIIPIPTESTSEETSVTESSSDEDSAPTRPTSTPIAVSESSSKETSIEWETPSVTITEDKRKDISLCTVASITNKTYTAKAISPAPAVKYGKTALKKGTDYTLSYKNNKNVGKATVTITGKGSYKGSIKKTFKIIPKGTTVSKLTSPKSKTLKAVWKKQATQTTGYQIQYSTSSKFTAKTTKTVTIKSNKTTAKTIAKLKGKKKYYVRIRTYKTVSKVNYFSTWSKAKALTVKK